MNPPTALVGLELAQFAGADFARLLGEETERWRKVAIARTLPLLTAQFPVDVGHVTLDAGINCSSVTYRLPLETNVTDVCSAVVCV